MMNTNIIKLSNEDLENIVGGNSIDLFLVYAEYLDQLYEKYNIRGLRNLKKVCTPEERAGIKQLYKAFIDDSIEECSDSRPAI